ncbi:MAG: hypothetical protein SVU69_07745 [Pseudomonadota bacterium]|nr:hypothetical protein [Pseudomonadota bacterium]
MSRLRASASQGVMRHRWKFFVLGVGLLLLGFYFSLMPPEVGQEFLRVLDRNATAGVVLLRFSGLFFFLLGGMGFKMKFDRDYFPERYRNRKD